MLHGAAAAMGEVAAHGGDALRARLDDGDEARALAAHFCLHALARERIGDEHGARRGVGDAVALGAEARDVERLRVTHRAAHR